MELRDFLRAASKRERADVAVVCNDSVSYLYQLAGKHCGRRRERRQKLPV
jgi:hypothetical protein